METRIFSVQKDTVNPNANETESAIKTVYENGVGRHFFETMGIPVLLGRSIDSGDKIGAPKLGGDQ